MIVRVASPLSLSWFFPLELVLLMVPDFLLPCIDHYDLQWYTTNLMLLLVLLDPSSESLNSSSVAVAPSREATTTTTACYATLQLVQLVVVKNVCCLCAAGMTS